MLVEFVAFFPSSPVLLRRRSISKLTFASFVDFILQNAVSYQMAQRDRSFFESNQLRNNRRGPSRLSSSSPFFSTSSSSHYNHNHACPSLQEYKHRFQLSRPQPLRSNLAQSLAALTHHVSPSRLRMINDQVPKIVVLTGDEDSLVRVGESVRLVKEGLTRAEGESEWV